MPESNLFKRGSVFCIRVVVDGRKHVESLRTADVKEARKRRDRRLEMLRASPWRGRERKEWAAAAVGWHANERNQLAPMTLRRYLSSLKQVEPWLMALTVDEIDGAVLRKMIRERREAGATAATIRRDLTAVSRVLEFAKANEWRDGVNPTLDVRSLLRERRDPIVLPTDDAIAAVLDSCPAEFAALVVAARLTGARQNELVMAKWPSFNEAAATLEVVGKGNRRRVISLSAVALAHIKSLARRGEHIFCSTDGNPFRMASTYFAHYRRAAEAKAKREGRGLRRFRFHDLRHLAAVEMLRGGAGIYAVQRHLGHASIVMTEWYLSFLTPDEADRARQG
ncbi:MAG TPA: tyrosine-type recombinase/integrase [Roseiarcus sp.]|jgi:integrase/recombinase XerD|nr:tyrosine-type recombinase/integrase [Roseiarcus sp.]